jgi:hypothetical protein
MPSKPDTIHQDTNLCKRLYQARWAVGYYGFCDLCDSTAEKIFQKSNSRARCFISCIYDNVLVRESMEIYQQKVWEHSLPDVLHPSSKCTWMLGLITRLDRRTVGSAVAFRDTSRTSLLRRCDQGYCRTTLCSNSDLRPFLHHCCNRNGWGARSIQAWWSRQGTTILIRITVGCNCCATMSPVMEIACLLGKPL